MRTGYETIKTMYSSFVYGFLLFLDFSVQCVFLLHIVVWKSLSIQWFCCDIPKSNRGIVCVHFYIQSTIMYKLRYDYDILVV